MGVGEGEEVGEGGGRRFSLELKKILEPGGGSEKGKRKKKRKKKEKKRKKKKKEKNLLSCSPKCVFVLICFFLCDSFSNLRHEKGLISGLSSMEKTNTHAKTPKKSKKKTLWGQEYQEKKKKKSSLLLN